MENNERENSARPNIEGRQRQSNERAGDGREHIASPYISLQKIDGWAIAHEAFLLVSVKKFG